MSSIFHASRPGESSVHVALALAAAALVAGACAVLVWSFAPIPVVVDGRLSALRPGSTVADIVSAGLAQSPRGDLLAVKGGIARRGGGMPPRILVGGRVADPRMRLFPGVPVSSSRGRDVTEGVVTLLVATPVPVEQSGQGPDVVVRRLGASGLERVTMGRVSRGVLEHLLIRPAVSMRLTRRPFPPGTPVVALTFDDGPWPGQTERVLEILRAEGVRATFFMTGVRVRMAPALAREVALQGHLVGNHTQTHQILGRATSAQVVYQMATGAETLRLHVGIEPHWFRAPGGAVTPFVRAEAAALGEGIAGWTVDPTDWRKPGADTIMWRVLGAVKPGAIILMHDGGGDRSQTIAALPRIIEQLRARGYRFVTLDDLGPAN